MSIESKINQNEEFQEAVNTFYTLKGQYDEEIEELRHKISKKSNLSNKEKRDEFKKLKPRCVNCNRKVGTIFEVKYDKSTDGRRAKAMCGDRVDPCPLDIELDLGNISNITDDLKKEEELVKDLKKKIIILKNDLLFGYTTTEKAVEEFEELKKDLSSATEMYEIILVSSISYYGDGPIQNEEMKKLELDIFNDIKQIKSYMSDFNRKKDVQYAQDAVTFMISQLTPKIISLRKIKYPIMTVDKSDKQCKLVQKRFDYSLTETNNAISEQGIINFKIGMK